MSARVANPVNALGRGVRLEGGAPRWDGRWFG
jgi:hypothetical protein